MKDHYWLVGVHKCTGYEDKILVYTREKARTEAKKLTSVCEKFENYIHKGVYKKISQREAQKIARREGKNLSTIVLKKAEGDITPKRRIRQYDPLNKS